MTRKVGSNRPTWEEFQSYLDSELPMNFCLFLERPVHLRSNPALGGVMLDLDLDKTESFPDLSQYEELKDSHIHERGHRVLRIHVTNQYIYQDFFAFCNSVADRVKEEEISSLSAFMASLETFPQLFEKKKNLSKQVVIGLFGELWLLKNLIKEIGSESVNYWKGAERNVHDFRWAEWEVEVKTTTSERRIHKISSVDQLRPSPDKTLHFVSFQITETASSGYSVADLISECRSALRMDDELMQFDRKLQGVISKSQEASTLLQQEYLHRDAPSISVVDKAFPGITLDCLGTFLSKDLIPRIRSIKYEIDVTGLGVSVQDEDLIKLIS